MVPGAPASVRSWAQRRPEVILTTTAPDGVTGWDVKPWLLLQELSAGRRDAVWLDDDIIVSRPISTMLEEFPPDSLIVAQDWEAGRFGSREPTLGLALGAPLPAYQYLFYPCNRGSPAAPAALARVDARSRLSRGAIGALGTPPASPFKRSMALERASGKRRVQSRSLRVHSIGAAYRSVRGLFGLSASASLTGPVPWPPALDPLHRP